MANMLKTISLYKIKIQVKMLKLKSLYFLVSLILVIIIDMQNSLVKSLLAQIKNILTQAKVLVDANQVIL